MTDYCLFTGKPLDNNNKIAHAIPECMGGRITSKTVTRGDFDNQTSSFDAKLFDSHENLIQALGPLMSSRHRPAPQKVWIAGEENRYVRMENGSLRQQGIEVERSSKTGLPIAVQGYDQERMESILKQAHGNDVKFTKKLIPVTQKTEVKVRMPITVEAELAILKTILLAFDIKLKKDKKRFTRSPSLAMTKKVVSDSVTKTDSYLSSDQFSCHFPKISLGIQYNKSQFFEKLRNRIDGRRQEFEHVLIASGDIVKQTLDVVWNIFGFEPWGFRISKTWEEYDFTAIIINQPLKGGTVLGPLFLDAPRDICVYTNWRSFHENINDPSIESNIILPIYNCRTDICRKAKLKTEREADDYVWNAIIDTATNSVSEDHHILFAIKEQSHPIGREK